MERRLETDGVEVASEKSGYLQIVRYEDLVKIAQSTDTVIALSYRPGHFITAGLPLARVWPPTGTEAVTRALNRAHVPGAHRTLTQDPVFPIDQLVEIAIRALSAAVNDTFTALTCIDWLSDGLCKVSERHMPPGVYRDDTGVIRILAPIPDYARIVNRASDKIRQASREMPAVAIRQMDGLTKVLWHTVSARAAPHPGHPGRADRAGHRHRRARPRRPGRRAGPLRQVPGRPRPTWTGPGRSDPASGEGRRRRCRSRGRGGRIHF